MVLTAGQHSSVVMTWAHPEFRVAAYTVGGNASGVVAPSLSGLAGEGALEFRGVPYRDSVPAGTLVLSSGLGGVYPKGIPVGTVTGVVREQAGWERVYRLLPAANPGAVAHVMVLVAPPAASMERRLSQRLRAGGDAAGFDREGTAGRLHRDRASGGRRKAAAAARAEAAAKAAAARATPRPAPPPPAAAPPTPAAGDSAR